MNSYEIRVGTSAGDLAALFLDVSSIADYFLLVVRPDLKLSRSGTALLEDIAPWLDRSWESSEWPGTKLLTGTVKILRYRDPHRVVTCCLGRVVSPFAFAQPDYPEDPCLLRADQSPIFTTISHERDAYLNLEPFEFQRLTELSQHELTISK